MVTARLGQSLFAVLFLPPLLGASCSLLLFIGNSYTDAFGIPWMLEAFAAARGEPTIRPQAHLQGGFTLQRYIDDGPLPGIRSVGAEPMLYLTWARPAHPHQTIGKKGRVPG